MVLVAHTILNVRGHNTRLDILDPPEPRYDHTASMRAAKAVAISVVVAIAVAVGTIAVANSSGQ